MIVVKFTNTDEFIAELGRDRLRDNQSGSPRDLGIIQDGIVRITRQYKASGMSPNVALVALLATYVTTNGHIVRLEAFCGDYWRGDTQQSEYVEQAERVLEQSIRGKAETAGLEVLDGHFAETDTQAS